MTDNARALIQAFDDVRAEEFASLSDADKLEIDGIRSAMNTILSQPNGEDLMYGCIDRALRRAIGDTEPIARSMDPYASPESDIEQAIRHARQSCCKGEL